MEIGHTFLRKLYSRRPLEYDCLSYEEWLYAMIEVDKAIVTIPRVKKYNFYPYRITEHGYKLFNEGYNETVKTAKRNRARNVL